MEKAVSISRHFYCDSNELSFLSNNISPYYRLLRVVSVTIFVASVHVNRVTCQTVCLMKSITTDTNMRIKLLSPKGIQVNKACVLYRKKYSCHENVL